MKQRLLMMVLALGMLSINGSAQTKKRTPQVKRTTTTTTKPATTTTTKERQVGSDGYIWYRLKKGNLYGAQDIEGRVIIPIKYTEVEYNSGTDIIQVSEVVSCQSKLLEKFIGKLKRMTEG